ncbi:MAG: VWA domain-containing protein [Phycisphaerales bacterium]|nr:VWA domain-containing protein [Phycisphaerales bacterium]
MLTTCTQPFRDRSLGGAAVACALLIGILIWAMLAPVAGAGGTGRGGIGSGSGPGTGDGGGTGISGAGPGAGLKGTGPGAVPDGDTDVLRGTPDGVDPQSDTQPLNELAGATVVIPEFGFDVDEVPPPVTPPTTASTAPFGTDPNAKTREGVSGAAGGAEFMGVRSKGQKFVYVFDISGSMATDNRIIHAQLELQRSIDRLGPDTEFFIILFESGAHPMLNPTLVRANKGNKAKYIAWVKEQVPQGGTRPEAAMAQALAMKPDAIFLMTDGEFEDIAAVDAAINSGNSSREVMIHAVAFHSQDGEAQLQAIAAKNNGQYRYVPPPSAVP